METNSCASDNVASHAKYIWAVVPHLHTVKPSIHKNTYGASRHANFALKLRFQHHKGQAKLTSITKEECTNSNESNTSRISTIHTSIQKEQNI